MTLNTDCVAKFSLENAACDGVLRMPDGEWIVGFAKNFGNASSYIAVLWGVLEGLKICLRHGFLCVEL